MKFNMPIAFITGVELNRFAVVYKQSIYGLLFYF